MKVSELCGKIGAKVITLPDGDREINGAYCGDLLSWVMGRASSGNVWITIMSNINVVAVASLADTSCVLLAEGVEFEEDVRLTAQSKGINVLSSDKSAYELCSELNGLI